MTKTSLSRRSSSAMASFSAWRTVISTISTPSGRSGSLCATNFGASAPAGALASAGTVGASASAGVCAASDEPVCAAVCVPSPGSSPSASTSAIGVLTFTPSVPSSIISALTTPSSTDSTSIVALSVSISASTSPDLTLSPTLTSHLDSLPSSMVGESAGIRIWGISALQDKGAGHVGHAAIVGFLGEFGGNDAPVVDRAGLCRGHGGTRRLDERPAADDQAQRDEDQEGNDGAHIDIERLGSCRTSLRPQLPELPPATRHESTQPGAGRHHPHERDGLHDRHDEQKHRKKHADAEQDPYLPPPALMVMSVQTSDASG